MAKKQVRVKLNSAKNLARGSNFLVDLYSLTNIIKKGYAFVELF